MKFKAAILQMRSAAGELKKNTETVLSHMRTAAEHGADILLLPECFLNGYRMPIENQDAVTEESIWIRKLCEAAKKLRIGVTATAFAKGHKKPRNTAFVIDKEGRIKMRYDKVHTCRFADEKCLESGREFKVCDFHGVRLGIMICYDREYPESARVLMMKGAEIILVPNDCEQMAPRVQALSTRAYENMVGVAMANPDGERAGCSCAYSPVCWDEEGNCIDNTILLADSETQGLFYAEFDMDRLRAYREKEMMGNTFRRTETYGELLNPEITYPFIREGQERHQIW